MTEEQIKLRGYYEETNPAKRRKLLLRALEDGEDREGNQLRREIWERRYSSSLDLERRRERADGFLRLWIDLKTLAENPPGRFWVRREQKNLQAKLNKLGFYEFYERSDLARELLYQECLNVARVYVHLCFSDRNYSSAVLGMMQMKKGRVQNKIVNDLNGICRDLPGIIQIPEPLNLLLRAAKDTREELSERLEEEE